MQMELEPLTPITGISSVWLFVLAVIAVAIMVATVTVFAISSARTRRIMLGMLGILIVGITITQVALLWTMGYTHDSWREAVVHHGAGDWDSASWLSDLESETEAIGPDPFDYPDHEHAHDAMDNLNDLEPPTDVATPPNKRLDAAAFLKTSPDETSLDEGSSNASPAQREVSEGLDVAPTPEESLPAWIDEPARRIGNAYLVPVVAGPFTTRMECDADLPRVIRAALDDYIGLRMGSVANGKVLVSDAFLREHLLEEATVVEQWRDHSVGRMVSLHAQVRFDQVVNAEIDREFRKVFVRGRIESVGVMAVGLLAVLALFYAFLRLDQATTGRYRHRLVFAACLLAMVVVAGGVLILA